MHDNKPIRSKPSDSIRGGSSTLDYAYNEQAGAFKSLDSIVGRLIPLGDATSVINVGKTGALVALFSVGTGGLVAYGESPTLAAPTTGADGVFLRADDYTIIALGPDEHFIRATGTVWAYLVDDDTVWKK